MAYSARNPRSLPRTRRWVYAARQIRTNFNQIPKTLQASRGLYSARGQNTANAPTSATSSIKWNPGHYMQARSLDQSGSGKQNRLDITNYLAGSTPNLIGANFVYTWGSQEVVQGQYKIVDTIINDFVFLQQTLPGMRMGIWTRSFSNQGSSWMTSANHTTINGDTGIVPSYIVNCGGSLQSTDKTMYSTSIPRSPNPSQYGWTMSQWNAGTSAYQYIIAGNWWHPVIAQCFLNYYHAVASCPVPTLVINGVTYAGYTINTHPFIEMCGSWDEGSVAFGQGGSFSVEPADDLNAFVGATGSFTGGTQYQTPGPNGGNGVKCVCQQVYAAREQVWIGATKVPTKTWTATDVSGAPGSWTVNQGFTNTQVGSCLSYIITCNDGATTVQEYRNHIANLYAGRVSFGGADMIGSFFGQNSAGSPWTTPGPYPSPAAHSQEALNLLIGGVYQFETSRSSNGTFTPPYTSVPSGGTDYRGKMPIISYIEGATDYLSNQQPPWATTNALKMAAIYNAALFAGASHMWWQNTDTTFSTTVWDSYIEPAIAIMGGTNTALPLAFQ